jgi:hypothetical protein
MPKKQLITFVVIDLILVAIVIVAVLNHVRVLYAMLAFIVLSSINGIYLIVTVIRKPNA